MGYSPLGGSSDRAPEAHGTTLLEHPTVNAIAKDANKTPGQVLIRWALQRGVISIPKSSNPDRLAQNFGTLDWDLPNTAMEQLAGLESDFRYVRLFACSFHNDTPCTTTQWTNKPKGGVGGGGGGGGG
eukprot:COSAG02_NODE_68_length_42582_cov_52.351129_49_plen_127_part_01